MDTPSLRVRIDDPDAAEIPRDLSEALDDAPDLRAVRDALTPGARRAFVARIAAAKRPETRPARIAAVLADLGSDAPSPYPQARQRNARGRSGVS